MITALLLGGVSVLLFSFLGSAWCVKDTKIERKRLQREYDCQQRAIGARCVNENIALVEGDLLKGLYGHFPPAPEFRPIDTRPPKPKPVAMFKSRAYPPVLTCGRHGLKYVSDTRCPKCLEQECRSSFIGRRCPCECGIGKVCHACAPVEVGNSEYWMEKNRQATPCLSCGRAVPVSGSKLCAGCDVPSSHVSTPEWQRYRMEEVRKILGTYSVPTVWDEKTQAVLPDVPRVVHDFGGRANTLSF